MTCSVVFSYIFTDFGFSVDNEAISSFLEITSVLCDLGLRSSCSSEGTEDDILCDDIIELLEEDIIGAGGSSTVGAAVTVFSVDLRKPRPKKL
jgi:hypothetical protein